MNDKQLQSLIGMALEAEELAAGPTPVSAHAPSQRGAARGRRLMLGAASGLLAAGLMIAASIIAFSQRSVPSPADPTPVALGNGKVDGTPAPLPGDGVVIAAAAGCPEESVVLAIYEDAAGVIRCIRWREHDWDEGRCLREVDPAELLSAGFVPPCVPGLKPRSLMVVALSGPRERLPWTDESAQALATCIAGSPMADPEPSHSAACAAAGCVPPDVTVRVETLAMNR